MAKKEQQMKKNEIPFFGRKLAMLRKSRHLTQPELADAIGVTREMISYYESRATNPTLDVIRKLADFFDVSADAFIYEEQNDRHKRGPKSKLERQCEQLSKLPQAKQKLLSEMIEAAIKNES